MKKQDVILRALVFGGEVSLAVADTTALVNEAIRIHKLSPLSAAALGRTLTVAAYMCSSLKDERGALSVTIKGDGAGGTVSVSGDAALHMRGYIDEPQADLPPNAQGKLDEKGLFVASEVLAKHDENYMPPEAAEALEAAHKAGVEKAKHGGAAQPNGA